MKGWKEQMKLENGQDIIVIDGRRDGYAPNQLGSTMTVGELIGFLEDYDEETPIMIVNDRGYTYGRITYDSIDCGTYDDDADKIFCSLTEDAY